MKEKEAKRDQLRKELLSQDASLVWEKEQYLWLLSRVNQNIPDIEQDPMFFSTLKNKLRYHLITKYVPAPQPNSWQKFMLYGFPSLALGLALIYILPLHSLDPTPLSPDVIVFSGTSVSEDSELQDIQGIADSNDRLWESTARQEKETSLAPQQDNLALKQRSIIPQELKTSSIQDSSSSKQDESNLQSATFMQQGDTWDWAELSSYNNNFEHYSRGTNTKDWQLDYNVSYDENDITYSSPIFLDGKLLVKSCNKVVFLDNPISLSRWPGLRWVRTSASDDETPSYDLIITIEKDNIVAIEWLEELCP